MSEENILSIIVPEKRARRMHDFSSLAESMREIGLLHPITITSEKVLVSGLHRLRAAESLGWQAIEAKVLTGDELDAELAEIDENLMSHHLTVAEQSEHIARRDALLKARGERAERGGSGSNQYDSKPVTVTGLQKTTEDLARDAGMSKSSYEKRVKIGHGLAEGTLAILNDLDPSDCDLPNSTRQLNYLAGVDSPEDQEEIARRVATGEAVTVWQASDQLKEERAQGETTNGSGSVQEAHEKLVESIRKEQENAPPLAIVRIKKVFAEYSVEWSDGTSNRVTRKALSDYGWKDQLCSHCGVGVARKDKS